ncbi:MAG: hypothetical protein CSA95_05750 [Bacteroidetes bacterium]|nr:MAG: hypothetical protein CSA95_05750 [Bacteroidota bacterium]PIE87724.1 MAG: hypothetical protein CSA04_05535 [Bacteroidota bacterium]
MKNLYTKIWWIIALCIMISLHSWGQTYEFKPMDSDHGLVLKTAKTNKTELRFTLQSFTMDKILVNGELMDKVMMPGAMLPAEEGTPDLPSIGRYVALPQGASASLKVISFKETHYANVEVSPAPRIPKVSDDSPLHYEKDNSIYHTNAFYPENPFMLSENMKIRGVDAVVLGISPFQYNPITKELIVYTEVELEVIFEGGNGHFGEDRLRSRFWEPILQDVLINYSALPKVDFFPEDQPESKNTNFEYVIITPDNPLFITWADSLRRFRNAQGIKTGVFQLQQIGGNNAGAIETFINNAYNNWQIPPAACLLMADYGNSGDNCITSPIYDNYCVSDNIYADVDGDHLPEISFARMTAQNAGHLETMIGKMLSYENNPPVNPNFYDHPVVAGGWQTERWFILCAEVCQGFWANELEKEPVREYAIYSGTPGSSWSTASNTSTVVNYFGPNGLGYIPADPSYLNDWGGNASRINNDLNSGAFMILHRDHGMETGWGEPSYTNASLGGLNNDDLTFVLSINCLTGKYNIASTCFAEAFHRHEKGCTGIIAASETSYSFVNDTYCWGMFDHMWGNFDPNYGEDPQPSDWVRPCFANASGKFYLSASNWPSNTQNKTVTYHLFHHHGDAFQTVYYEMPQELTVTHPDELTPGTTSMEVTADVGSTICLSSNGTILDAEQSNGGVTTLNFQEVPVGTELLLTVTRQNFFRYEATIVVVGPPAAANTPVPSNNKNKVDIYTDLAWQGSGATHYEVYFGTDNPPTNIINGEEVTEPLFTLDQELDYEQTYYWQIISFNDYGNTGSEVWNFTSAGEPSEDFETGDFSLHNWQLSGDADWSVVNTTAKHESHAAESGAIGHGESSSLSIDFECSGFDKIRFYQKVSSEEGADKLIFLIDNTVKGEWSGETSWTLSEFTAGPGPHVFEWRYEKDASGSAGADKAWIDFIYFPPTAALSANAGEDAEICETSTHTTNGFASNYSSVLWTTDGDGTFEDETSLVTVYTPGDEDISNGLVEITLTAYAGSEQVSDKITLTINPSVETTSGEGVVCESGTTIDWFYATNYQEVEWSTTGDGTFNDVTLINPVYTPGPQDLANEEVDFDITLVALNGCENVTESLTSAVEAIPEAPTQPAGPDEVDTFYQSTSEYTTSGEANTYDWMLTPMAAGTFNSDEHTVTITWNTEFEGNAELKVKGINECGIGEYSEALSIHVYNTVNVDQYEREIVLSPNPCTDHVTLNYQAGKGETLHITLTSTEGSILYEETLQERGMISHQINTQMFTPGVYYLTLTSGEATSSRKLIIR